MKEIHPALQTLLRFHDRPQTNLKILLKRRLDRVDPGLRPAATRLVYGVTRRQAALDFVIQNRMKKPSGRISPRTRILLRLGAYLLLYSTDTPDYAVVNEIVSHVDTHRKGFANAVLRRLAREREGALRAVDSHPDAAVRHSISPTLIPELEKISTRLEEDLAYLNTEPVFHLRAAPSRASLKEIEEILNTAGVSTRELPAFPCLEISDTQAALNAVVTPGLAYLQNSGSQWVSLLAARLAGHTLLDACAAPGAKVLTLKQAKPGLTVFANDINRRRLRLIRPYLTGGVPGRDNIHLLASDITKPPLKPGADFDTVLVDAPCTSSGTLRKNPDLKIGIGPREISSHTGYQRGILDAVAARFAGSTVIYAVCSFIGAETEEGMDRLATEREAAAAAIEPIDTSPILEEYGFRFRTGRWGNYLLPDGRLNNDLFYVAAFRVPGRDGINPR